MNKPKLIKLLEAFQRAEKSVGRHTESQIVQEMQEAFEYYAKRWLREKLHSHIEQSVVDKVQSLMSESIVDQVREALSAS